MMRFYSAIISMVLAETQVILICILPRTLCIILSIFDGIGLKE